MPKHGKKFREAQSRVPEGRSFGPGEAVSLVKEHDEFVRERRVEQLAKLGPALPEIEASVSSHQSPTRGPATSMSACTRSILTPRMFWNLSW